jgi:hypothetical protein
MISEGAHGNQRALYLFEHCLVVEILINDFTDTLVRGFFVLLASGGEKITAVPVASSLHVHMFLLPLSSHRTADYRTLV